MRAHCCIVQTNVDTMEPSTESDNASLLQSALSLITPPPDPASFLNYSQPTSVLAVPYENRDEGTLGTSCIERPALAQASCTVGFVHAPDFFHRAEVIALLRRPAALRAIDLHVWW